MVVAHPATLAIHDLRVRYPGQRKPALDDVSLTAAAGEVCTVAGRTGAGKSTLCLAAAGFIPRVVRAAVEGTVRVGAIDAVAAPLAELAGHVGICFSSPALQLSASKPTVREELAFGLENLGVAPADMRPRIDAVLERLSIAHLAEREPLSLSGGEQQRVAVASILVMGTAAIVLDEPTAQLDPQGTAQLAALLAELARAGQAVLVAEHAPDVLAVGRRGLVLEEGRTVAVGSPGAALVEAAAAAPGIRLPTIVKLAVGAGIDLADAFDEEKVAAALAASMAGRRALATAPAHAPPPPPISITGGAGRAVIVDRLFHEYAGGIEAVRGISLRAEAGERVVVVGQNGSGKTTLLKHLIGILRPSAGRVLIGDRDISGVPVHELAAHVGFVFQSPEDQLFHSSVEREVAFGPRNLGLAPGEVERSVVRSLAAVGLLAVRATNPYDLGSSLRKLVALASVLAMEPAVLVLDEPTSGQDGPGVARVGGIVDAWAASGRTVIAATHDMEFAARHFDRIIAMRQGNSILEGAPADVFAAPNAELLASTGLRPPPAARIAARLGLAQVPRDAEELLAALARSAEGG